MRRNPVVDISPPKEKISTRNNIQVIARAAAILRTLRDAPEGLSLAEIARHLDLPRSTVQRIVEALDQENLVIAASPTRGVRLGPALLSLAAAARFEISEVAKKTMQVIAGQCKETVTLSLINGDKIVFIEQVAGTHHLRVEPPIGESLAIQSTAPGKAIMAVMDPGALNKLKRRLHFEQLTPHTITNWTDMLQELDKVRESGVAFDLEENALGISAAAVSLVLPNGEYAAISIPVPAQRFREEQSSLVEILLTHCGELQKTLSGNRHRY